MTACLVLGGARSGKSALAERLVLAAAVQAGGRPLYLATSDPAYTAADPEMTERLARHRTRRGDAWDLVEAPLDLVAALRSHAAPKRPILVDCLTLWLANLMAESRDPEVEAVELAAALPSLAGPVVLVSNEVGSGIVPENALARAFRDEAGRLNQMIAAACPTVVMTVAGLPLALKGAVADWQG